MSFNETQMAFGSWDLTLKSGEEGVPQELLDVLLIKEEPDASLGHIIITPTHVDPREVDPLTVARYTGVYRRNEFTETQKRLSGSGLVYWLGDEQDHGPEIPEEPQELDNVSFVDAITAVLPAAIEVGTIVPEIGVQDYIFLFETARTRLNAICSRYNAEYYITPQGTLNAGTPASLYPTFNAPTCFITRKNEGSDPQYKQLPLASAALGGDATNFATRQVNVATVDDEPTIVGEAEESTGKRDLHGNLVTITNVSGESQPDAANGDARAAALLAQAMQPRKSNRLSTAKYDIDGTLSVGDSVYVYDPESGYVDTANKVEYRGQYYFPAKVRVQAVTWPLCLNEDGSKPGVYFREPRVGIDPLEEITHDLTPYVVWENQGNTEVVVGALARSIIPLNPAPLGPIVNPVVNPEAPPPIPDPPTIFSEERSVLVKQPTTSGGDPMPATVTKFNVYASTTSGFTPGPTNYIGYISVVRADVITLGIPLLKSIKWESEDLTYFRTTAINSGGEGPASIEVSETAGLIPNAAILNLDAEKINAGTINVAIELNAAVINGGEINASEMNGGVITGALIQTAATGPRVALNNPGAGTDELNFIPDDLAVNPGVILVATDGAGVTRQSHMFIGAGSPEGATDQAFIDLISAPANDSGPSSALLYAENIVLQADDVNGSILLDQFGTSIEITEDVIDFVTDGATKMQILSDRMSFSWPLTMNSQNIDMAGPASTARLETGTSPALHGDALVRLISNTADVQLRVGHFTGTVALRDNGNVNWRDMELGILTYDTLTLRSDRALKTNIEELDPAECATLFARTKAKRYERLSNEGVEEWGWIAQEAPEVAQVKGESLKINPTTMQAIHWGTTQNILDRLTALESDSDDRQTR